MDESTKAIGYTAWASFFWGTSFVAIGFGLRDTEVWGFLFIRFLLASLITVIAVLLFSKGGFSIFKRRNIWILGIMNGFAFALQYLGQTQAPPGRSALLVNFNIVTVALLSFVVFGEKFTKMKAAAIPIAICGVFLLTTGGDLSGTGGGAILGDLMVFSAGTIWAFYIVLTKKEIDRLEGKEPLGFLAAVMVISTITLIVPTALYGTLPKPNVQGWFIIIYISFFCTFVAFLLWFKGLKKLSSTASCIVLLLEPVFAVAFSIALLHEPFGIGNAAGAMLILAAMVLVSKG